MGWYTLDSHSMTAKLVSHNEGQMLSEDAFESGLVKLTKNIDDSVTNSKKKKKTLFRRPIFFLGGEGFIF